MRILIAYEANFRAYGDALERAIMGLRPRVQGAVADSTVLASTSITAG